MTDDELTVCDVLADEQRNFTNVYTSNTDAIEAHTIDLHDSLYYTETEFVDLVNEKCFDFHNLTIISLNIANLHAKLRSLKLFINNITTAEKKIDIIVVVETHLSKSTNAGFTGQELKSILPGYDFFSQRQTDKERGWCRH